MANDQEDDDYGPLRYSIRLLIKHPTMNADLITSKLGLTPHMSSTAGNPRKTPKGHSLPGVYKVSAWGHSYDVEGNRLFGRDLMNSLGNLETHSEFVDEVVESGGSVQLIINLPGDVNIGDRLSWTTLRRFSILKVDLGIEVFPDFN